MTLLTDGHALPAGPEVDAPDRGPGRGFFDCRGHWHRLDEPDEPEVVSGGGTS